MNYLHIDSVQKSYGQKQVLTDIFLKCAKGEIIGLLGRNGTGKSTLLKIIFGSLPADQKYIKIEDQLIGGIRNNQKLIKYLPQNHFLPTHIKIQNIVSLFCSKINASSLKANKLIKPYLDKKPKLLSSGERRLIEILLIICADAKYILLEPFNGIDPLHKNYIKELIKEQSREKGFIITDHDYIDILDISTRMILMHDGGIKTIKEKNELIHWGYIH